ncbi:MAG: GDP-mannose 4,6-dehydratase [Candidatus Aureabacteria bacterium]|nr:GDP-mannose 4,6-dehydratase [Candidatus Auribacterota bacterium]
MKILVTGGAGFIGSSLIDKLLGEGNEVMCLDDFNDYYDPLIKRRNISAFAKEKKFRLVEADIRDFERIKNVIGPGQFDYVVHFAARAGVRPSIKDPKLYEEVNIGGTTNICEACRLSGCKNIIFASSSSVYGNSAEVPFSENSSGLSPESPYGSTKLCCEEILRAYHKNFGIKAACLRFFTVYGPRQRPEMAIHKFLRNIIEDKPVEIYGDGSSSRDYTFIDDIVSGILAVFKIDFNYKIINLGNSNPVNIRELIRIIEKVTGKKARVEFMPPQKGDVERTFADIGLASELLGYKPKVNIETGIKRFFDWLIGR